MRPELLAPDGRLKREAIRIGARARRELRALPRRRLGRRAAPVALPGRLRGGNRTPGAATSSLTQREGAIVAPQRMADSFLNLEGKDGLASPWDVHAAKLVDCVACHYAPQRPDARGRQAGTPRYVTATRAAVATRSSWCARITGSRSRTAARATTRCGRTRSCPTARGTSTCARLPGLPRVPADGARGRDGGRDGRDAAAARPPCGYRNVERRGGRALNTATVRPFRPLLVVRTGATARSASRP